MATVAGFGVVMLGMGQRSFDLSAIALVAVVASLVLTDLTGWLRLNRMLANVAGLTAVAISITDFIRFDRDTQLLAVANLLIYLELVLLFQEKHPRIYWQIVVLSLLQVVIGAALSMGAGFGLMLIAYMVVMLVALLLLFFQREAEIETDWPRVIRSVPLRGLSIAGEVASASLVTLLVTAAVFFSVPRYGNSMWQSGSVSYQPTVGFSGTVSLGSLGAVADNPELVMRVEFRDPYDESRPYRVHNEPLFRGSILSTYARGQWRYHVRGPGITAPLDILPQYIDKVIQRITLEPLDEPVIFGIHPMFRAARRSDDVLYDGDRQEYVRSDRALNVELQIETVTTGLDQGMQQAVTPDFAELMGGKLDVYRQLPGIPLRRGRAATNPNGPASGEDPAPMHELPELAAAAEREIERAGLTREDPYFAFNAARTLELYLRSPPFRYSLQPQPRDPSLDPIEDFIRNNPSGHCEYFASALALMLRTLGIPSRVVVGFKGGDYNQVGSFYLVRQLHAHAWVEAYLTKDEIPPERQPRSYGGKPGWLTLDPTPGADDSAAYRRGGLINAIADLGDYLKHLWSTYVVGLNAERQNEAIYRPLSQMADNVKQLVRGRESIHGLVWRWIVENAVTFRGMVAFAGVVVVIVLGVRRARGLGPLVRWLARRFRMRGRRPMRVGFYERLEHTLAAYGLRRSVQQTPLEFALAAGAEMVATAELRPHATLPRQIVEAYYRVRFGGRSLSAREQTAVDEALGRLTAVLSGRKSG
jgi:transglutaminase-like putative cysteine protease